MFKHVLKHFTTKKCVQQGIGPKKLLELFVVLHVNLSFINIGFLEVRLSPFSTELYFANENYEIFSPGPFAWEKTYRATLGHSRWLSCFVN